MVLQDDDRPGGGVQTCPRCGRTTVFHPRLARTYIHMFWLPIFPINRGQSVVQCDNCRWYGEASAARLMGWQMGMIATWFASHPSGIKRRSVSMAEGDASVAERIHTIVQQISPVLRWLSVLELLAEGAGLRGLSWGGRGAWVLPFMLSGCWRASFLRSAMGFVIAVPVQLGLATLCRRKLNPLQHLRVGVYSDRTIERIDVPGPYGAVPALYIVPRTEALGAICVVHGSGCDKTFYVWRLVNALMKRQLAVLLVDLDGHGESPRPQAYPAIL
ncbi:zinc ribbon domain-containing protein, partial [Candidatus Gracilibacteria bacterium]|nr:zinc ribbon domain-containing protein [Candidatus Gracilibacteria bacterium]